MESVTEPERDPDERVSLAPLDAETALRALLAVKPDDEDDPADQGIPVTGSMVKPDADDPAGG